MTTKLIIFFLMFTASCGPKEVKFPDPLPESNPFVTNAGLQLNKMGTFTKQATLNGSTIFTGGKNIPFSEYSSNQALTWYASKAIGSSTPVSFRGEITNGKLVIERIEDR